MWIVLFVMVVINECVVYCFNVLVGNVYGSCFIYDEVVMMGMGLKGCVIVLMMVVGFGVFMVGVFIGLVCSLMVCFLLLKFGEGLSVDV